MDFHVNLFVEWNVATAIVVTAKLSGAGVTDSSAPRRTLHCHALASTSAAELVSFMSVKVNQNFASLSYHYPFQCGEES